MGCISTVTGWRRPRELCAPHSDASSHDAFVCKQCQRWPSRDAMIVSGGSDVTATCEIKTPAVANKLTSSGHGNERFLTSCGVIR